MAVFEAAAPVNSLRWALVWATAGAAILGWGATQLPEWAELLIGVWSEIDLLVNPFESTAYSKGNVSIRAMATVDSVVRHPKAFVSVTGVTTSAVAIA